MKLKVSPKQLIFFVGALAIIFSFVVIFFINYWGSYGNSNEFAVLRNGEALENFTLKQSREPIFGLPVRLIIPKINVDAPFVYVALTPTGAMDVPKEPTEVAWFDLSPRPGERGSAVISGHYGWKNGIPAVFDDLNKLGKGDRVEVEDKRGAIITFVVRESRSYNQDADATEVFNFGDGKSHLNLITCKGIWDKTKKSYSDRLVVFADKE